MYLKETYRHLLMWDYEVYKKKKHAGVPQANTSSCNKRMGPIIRMTTEVKTMIACMFYLEDSL